MGHTIILALKYCEGLQLFLVPSLQCSIIALALVVSISLALRCWFNVKPETSIENTQAEMKSPQNKKKNYFHIIAGVHIW